MNSLTDELFADQTSILPNSYGIQRPMSQEVCNVFLRGKVQLYNLNIYIYI